MPELGRWNGYDELAEDPSQLDKSPYAFTWNNPVNLVDPDGRCPDCPSGYSIGQGWKDSSGAWWVRAEGSWVNTISDEVFNDEVIVGGGSSSSSGWGYWMNYGSSGGGSAGSSGGSSGSSGMGLGGILSGGGYRTPEISESHRPIGQVNRGFNEIDWEKINNALAGFEFGNSIKTELVDHAVRNNYKTATTAKEFNKLSPTQKNFRFENTLGKGGAQLVSVAKSLGTAAAIVTTGYTAYTTYDYYINKGGTDWKVGVKAGMDLVITGVGFLGPVGFGISTTYFILDSATGGFGGFGEIPKN